MSIVFGTFAAYGTPQLNDSAVEQLILHTASIRRSHGTDATTLLFTALEDLIPGRNPTKHAHVSKVLDMRLAKTRRAGQYGAFLAYLRELP